MMIRDILGLTAPWAGGTPDPTPTTRAHVQAALARLERDMERDPRHVDVVAALRAIVSWVEGR